MTRADQDIIALLRLCADSDCAANLPAADCRALLDFLAAPVAPPPGTVRVRVAVAVAPDGDWDAFGDAVTPDEVVVREMSYRTSPLARVTWVEADVPVPAPVVAEGRVVE